MKSSSPTSTIVPQGPQTSPGIDQQQRLVDALAEYHDAADAGHPPDRNVFLEKYADVREDLSGYLDSFDLIRGIAPQLRETNTPADTEAGGLPERAQLGDFEIVREIGRGGMGVVYEAEQVSVGRRVALKVLPFAAMLKSQQLERFRNEVRAAGSLNHLHIVAVYSVGNERGVHYYAMQLVEGHSLAEIIAAGRKREASRESRVESSESRAEGRESRAESRESGAERGGQSVDGPSPPTQPINRDTSGQPPAPVDQNAETQPLAELSTVRTTRPDLYWQTVAKLGQQAAEALHHAHNRGVVHRDIKPANLLVGSDEHLWVADFGLARLETDAGMTMSGDLWGTLRYMSPEQVAGDRAVVDHRTDVYSLGATLYELLALQPVFTSDDRQQLLHDVASTAPTPLRKLDPRIPADLETIVAKAMEKDAADRYTTAGELAVDLANYLEHRPIVARPPSLTARVNKWARRHSRLVAAAFALLLLGVVGLSIGGLMLAAANRATSTEKAQAEQNLLVAAKTIDRLLARYAEDAQAHGQLRHADDLLRDAVASYDELLTKSADPQLVLKAASAHGQLSDVLRLGAEFVEAHRIAEKGLKLFRRLADAVADSDVALAQQATLLDASGWAKLNIRDYSSAEWSFRESLALRDRLLSAEPHDIARRRGMLTAHNSLGVLLMESGRVAAGEKELRAAETLSETLPHDEKDSAERLNRQAGLQANLANVAVKQGDYHGAAIAFRRALQLQRRVVASLPEDPALHEQLYQARWSLADALIGSGNYSAAADEIESFSREFAERLQAQVEGVWLLVRCVEATKDNISLSQEIAKGRSSDGEPLLRRYHALARQLIEQSKSSTFAPPAVQQELAWLLATCPVRELRDGARASSIAEQLCEQDPKHDEHQHAMAAAYLEMHDYAEAAAAAEIARGYDGHRGDVYEFTLLALANSGLGDVDAANHWQEQVLAAYDEQRYPLDQGLRALVYELKKKHGGDR